MTTLGALLGVFVGHLDLQSLPGLRLLGNQFQDLSAVVSIGLIFLHSFVSLCIQERRLVVDENTVTTVPGRSIKQIIRLIRMYTLGLPRRIRIIVGRFIPLCNVIAKIHRVVSYFCGFKRQIIFRDLANSRKVVDCLVSLHVLWLIMAGRYLSSPAHF
jgi:hypothetical protein